MGNRWTLLFLPLVLALALVLFTRPVDTRATLSPANVGLGPNHAAAAGPAATATPAQGAYPPKGPASDKADGTPPPVAAAASGESWDVRHTPSVDAATIARVLQSYNSPAVGAAPAIYTLGLVYGIDPAYCLAFFIHESTAGTAGVARVTKSVGNIRTTPGYVDYRGYRKYATWEEGIEDWYQLIRDLYITEWELSTVDQIIPVYAPASDGNNPEVYISSVKKLVGGWRAGR